MNSRCHSRDLARYCKLSCCACQDSYQHANALLASCAGRFNLLLLPHRYLGAYGHLDLTEPVLQADILSAVLVIFVLLVELAHPSLEGTALKLQACIAAIAAGALYMIFMQRER